MAHRNVQEYSDDEEIVADSSTLTTHLSVPMGHTDDEEFDADSGRIPVFRRMQVQHADEGGIKEPYMPSSNFGLDPAEGQQQPFWIKAGGAPKDPWAAPPRGFMPKSMFGAPPFPEVMPVQKQKSVPGRVCPERFPSTYRLERTNLAVRSHAFQEGDSRPHSVQLLVKSLERAFEQAGIDVVEFRPAECTFNCSYQKGNLFLSFMVTVFLAPSQASSQLLEQYDENELVLVEVQLREGDGLYFSGLFRDLVDIVNNHGDVVIAGTLRYRPCPSHPYGEGLGLEPIMMKPPGHGPAPPPAPSGFPGKPIEAGSDGSNPEKLDDDMTEDVMLLSGMIREGFPTAQADAASVVAGLTLSAPFLQQLSMDGASNAAEALASASARLLVETPHRAARRQASVVVANLAFDPVLRAALLASDRCFKVSGSSCSKGGRSGSGVGGAGPHAQAQAEVFSRGLLDSLVLFAVGRSTTMTIRGAGGGERRGEEKAGAAEQEDQEEEEIGMRRDCMRALLGMSESEEARSTEAMKSLLQLKAGLSGQGANDGTLKDRLAACQDVLKSFA